MDFFVNCDSFWRGEPGKFVILSRRLFVQRVYKYTIELEKHISPMEKNIYGGTPTCHWDEKHSTNCNCLIDYMARSFLVLRYVWPSCSIEKKCKNHFFSVQTTYISLYVVYIYAVRQYDTFITLYHYLKSQIFCSQNRYLYLFQNSDPEKNCTSLVNLGTNYLILPRSDTSCYYTNLIRTFRVMLCMLFHHSGPHLRTRKDLVLKYNTVI